MSADKSNPLSWGEKWKLGVVVFLAGAVLMGLEIAGSRVLAPHFGNSVFVWGSLISVFLIALSGGYYFGGRVADLHPSHKLLGAICVLVAFWIFGIAIASQSICEALARGGLSEQTGPLVASMVLFLAPGVGMGMVSPFAIRLATQSLASVGQIAGTLYALSTMGSIAGTMLTTFVFIPLLGLAMILKGLALLLLLAAVPAFVLRGDSRPSAINVGATVLIALGGLLWPTSVRLALREGEKIVLDVETPYHHISVVDNESQSSRELRFDRFAESTIHTSPPYEGGGRGGYYTDYFHLAFLARGDHERSEPSAEAGRVRRALFIGAGGGVGPRAFHLHDPEMEIDVVDIDPKVLEIAYSHFHLDRSPLIHAIAQDGRMFLRNSDEQYDAIILDAFTIGGRIPFHLVTQEFMRLCNDRLTDNGVFLMNINSALAGKLSGIYRSMFRTIDSVFPQTYAFAKGQRWSDPTETMNIILVASKDEHRLSSSDWVSRVRRHTTSSYVTSDRLLKAAEDLVGDTQVGDAPLFTDDYAPIDTMPFSS